MCNLRRCFQSIGILYAKIYLLQTQAWCWERHRLTDPIAQGGGESLDQSGHNSKGTTHSKGLNWRFLGKNCTQFGTELKEPVKIGDKWEVIFAPRSKGRGRRNCTRGESGKSQSCGRGLPGRTRALKEHSRRNQTNGGQGYGADEDGHLLPLASWFSSHAYWPNSNGKPRIRGHRYYSPETSASQGMESEARANGAKPAKSPRLRVRTPGSSCGTLALRLWTRLNISRFLGKDRGDGFSGLFQFLHPVALIRELCRTKRSHVATMVITRL